MLAFSPTTGILGRPNDLLIVASTSKYRGPRNAFRNFAGACGAGHVCGKGNEQAVNDGAVKYAVPPVPAPQPVGKFPHGPRNVELLKLCFAPPEYAAGISWE